MKITIDVTPFEAEEILFALSLRARQLERLPQEVAGTDTLGEKLSLSFESAFKWSPETYHHHRKHDLKVKLLMPKTSYR